MGVMRWRLNASAAARASPRYWRRFEMEIQSVAVIGAGVMGAGIAAHVANAGVNVLLLDIVKPGSANRNAIAEGAIARLRKMEPAPLMGSRAARLIKPGNIEDNLDDLKNVDWIIEAVVERADIKQG